MDGRSFTTHRWGEQKCTIDIIRMNVLKNPTPVVAHATKVRVRNASSRLNGASLQLAPALCVVQAWFWKTRGRLSKNKHVFFVQQGFLNLPEDARRLITQWNLSFPFFNESPCTDIGEIMTGKYMYLHGWGGWCWQKLRFNFTGQSILLHTICLKSSDNVRPCERR